MDAAYEPFGLSVLTPFLGSGKMPGFADNDIRKQEKVPPGLRAKRQEALL